MEHKKNILVLVPDGTGIKNYLYTRLFKGEGIKRGLLHSFDKETLTEISKHFPAEYQQQIPKYKESFREKFLRELIHRARLIHNAKISSNPTILKFWGKRPKSLKLKVFYTAVIFTARFYTNYKAILRLESRYDKALRKNPFYGECRSLLEQHRPDILFCTHQRALSAPGIFMAARDLGIRTVTVIYSWDNLPKARLALRADQYLLWSDHMFAEMQLFYPEIDSEKLVVTGTPQFEFYEHEKHLIPKDEFYAKYDLDPKKRILCFSGDDVRTSPYDPQYLNDIAQEILDGPYKDEFQILFRRCPVDVSGRYQAVVKRFPELIKEAPPIWNFNSKVWTTIYPASEDIDLLVSTAFYADVVVNVGSTMAFDFGMFGKPCIFINYDVPEASSWSVNTVYQYQHFRSMPNSSAVLWLSNKNEVNSLLKKVLLGEKTTINDWFQEVVKDPNQASEKIRKLLL